MIRNFCDFFLSRESFEIKICLDVTEKYVTFQRITHLGEKCMYPGTLRDVLRQVSIDVLLNQQQKIDQTKNSHV